MKLSTQNNHIHMTGLEPVYKGDLPVLINPLLNGFQQLEHFFTTREGGVSEGYCSSLNLSFNLSDETERVHENFRRVSKALGCCEKDIVLTAQTHTANIKIVSGSDAGKGLVSPMEWADVDGLITDEKGIALSVFTADCIPILFFDPVKEVIGTAHCGWRGTVANLQAKMVDCLKELYGTEPSNLYAVMGPGICQDCYEVSEDVAFAFMKEEKKLMPQLLLLKEKGIYDRRENLSMVKPGKGAGKFQVDLWLCNLCKLMERGVLPEHIGISQYCTAMNSQTLFSHRATGGKRGLMGGFIRMKMAEEEK